MFRGINWTVAAAAFIAPALAWYGMTFTVATLVLRLWRRP